MPSAPVMHVVAGPPGSGKSSSFPVSETGLPHFNIDDRAALLNGGSYQGIPSEIRAKAQGFLTYMECVATNEAEENLRRVQVRGMAGGHSAPALRY